MPLLAVLLAALLVVVPAASAQTAVSIVDEAVAGLESSPVYVHPGAGDVLSEAEADTVRRRIREADVGPIYVAVLPDEVVDGYGGDLRSALVDLYERMGRRPGVFAAATDGEFQAGGPEGTSSAADAAVAEHEGEGLAAVLLGFVDELASQASGGGGSEGGGDGGSGGLVLLGLLAVGGGAIALSRRSRRRRELAELEEVKANVRDELVALGDELRALDLDVQMPDANPEAVADYHRAVECYDRAETAWERARRVDDLEPVGAALEEGRWALQSARARLDGRRPPERRLPCFFDPRHGPSSRDVEWAPDGGAPRLVPACEADAMRVEAGIEPYARELVVGGQRMPYWQAGPTYAPFMGGFFGGGLLPGLMVGTMLGSAMAPAVVFGHDHLGGDGGGLDFGGGDFGGGDFGGGDF